MTAPGLTLEDVQRSLTFAAWPASSANLERIIVRHLDTVKTLQGLQPKMADLIVFVSQGFNQGECAQKLGVCRNTMNALQRRLRREFYTDLAVPGVIPKMSMEKAAQPQRRKRR